MSTILNQDDLKPGLHFLISGLKDENHTLNPIFVGVPFKITAISLPFVNVQFVTNPGGLPVILDTRQLVLMRVTRQYVNSFRILAPSYYKKSKKGQKGRENGDGALPSDNISLQLGSGGGGFASYKGYDKP